MPKREKKTQLTKLKARQYTIYGIFDFKLNKLISVCLDMDQLETEFDLGDYDSERFDIVSFKVMLA